MKRLLSQAEAWQRIEPRQKRLRQHLQIADEGNSVWTKTPDNKTLSPGCQACKTGTWMCVFVGNKCNATCQYCPQGSREDKAARPEDSQATGYMPISRLKELITSQSPLVTGLSYTGGEPLLYLEKVIDIATFVSRNHPHIYQWLYTNGLLATEAVFAALADKNIREIRFHLGATNYSAEIVDRMKAAKKYFEHVNVETPATPTAKEQLLQNGLLLRLQDVGIDQINLSELSIHNAMSKRYVGSADLYLYYTAVHNAISPLFSREITYDIMDYAVKHHLDIIINDCSNDAKYWQQTSCRKTKIQLLC